MSLRFRPHLFAALDVSLRVLSALCLAFGLFHLAFVPGIDVTFQGSMFTWPMHELRGTSEADAKPKRSHQILKWHDVAESERWADMVLDEDLRKKYGAGWSDKRKQVPPEWLDKVACDVGASGSVAPRKGKRSYAELPGPQGEAARRVLQKIQHEVDAARGDSEEVDMTDVQATLAGIIADENQVLIEQSLPQLPHKNSVGWAYGLRKSMGWKKRRVGNTEDKDMSLEDEASFKKFFCDLVTSKTIPQALWIAHDEFKEYHYQWGKGTSVLTTPKERSQARIAAKVQRVHNSRNSVTMGLLLSPSLGVLRAYLLYKKVSKVKKDRIEKEFGSMVSVGANSTGNMRSETHVDWFLPQVLLSLSRQTTGAFCEASYFR